MRSPTDNEWAEIDERILANDILGSIRRILLACGVPLQEAAEINKARYLKLRAERGTEFVCDHDKYWSGYAECPEEAIAKDV